MDLRPLLLLTPALMLATPGVNLYISFQSLQQLDALASSKIRSLEDATSYVRQSAVLCGAADPGSLPESLESRLAKAEWDAAREPSKLVSDEQVASAFNFMSDEFGVQHPARLTASDILQYRSVQASIFPNVFSPKTVSGSRPLGALVMLYQLWYNGGVTEGVRNAAKLDRAPGSQKVTSGQVVVRLGTDQNASAAARRYRASGGLYLAQASPEQIHRLIERLAEILSLPGRR
jgi:hypothetical protein